MERWMKRIDTQGITYIEPLDGSPDWYWGMDYTHGDLYEAEELFRQNHPVGGNKLVFVRCPEGRVIQPVTAGKGQYLGRPTGCGGKILILRVDFPQEVIEIFRFDPEPEEVETLAEIPLAAAEDCYNLLLKQSPLMLTRQGKDDTFEILWPEKLRLTMGNTEAFVCRREDRLYFTAWYEDPEYREEVIVRSMASGEVLERFPGSWMTMPSGQTWILG